MGGRGSGSGFGFGPGGGNLVVELDASDGSKIDLTEFPLEYGQPETLSFKERATVDAFETKRYKAKVEYGTLITVDGQQLIEKRGGKGSVSLLSRLYAQASVMSHNHPRSDAGLLGGTFSPEDLNTFGSTRISTMRATASEGTYSITKTGTFDAPGLRQYYNSQQAQIQRTYAAKTAGAAAAYRSTVADYQAGRVPYSAVENAYKTYRQTANYEFNRKLVSLHNALVAGQSQYGYTYTLERRK